VRKAELDGVKGIGPVTTRLIISERKKSEFKSWDDFISRVKGVGDKSAVKFSANGLTVAGAAYTGAGAADAKAKTDARKTDKPVVEKAKDAVKETAKDVKAAVTPTKTEAAKPATSAASATKK